MEVLKEKDLKLLSRKRVSLMINHNSSTPSRKNLIQDVAKKFKVKPEAVIIKHIYPQFGQGKTKIIAHIYQDEKKKVVFEHKNLVKKHEIKAETKPEAATPSEEPSKESTTEETIQEEAPALENVEEKSSEDTEKQAEEKSE